VHVYFIGVMIYYPIKQGTCSIAAGADKCYNMKNVTSRQGHSNSREASSR